MQTRSKGPVSFGEKTQQEAFDPYGNLISKGAIYDIPNVGKYNARQVVENLIRSKKGLRLRITLRIMLGMREIKERLIINGMPSKRLRFFRRN